MPPVSASAAAAASASAAVRWRRRRHGGGGVLGIPRTMAAGGKRHLINVDNHRWHNKLVAIVVIGS